MTLRIDSFILRVSHGSLRAQTRLFFDLFKLRIGLVIGFTALAGAGRDAGGPPVSAFGFLLLALAVPLASAAARAHSTSTSSAISTRTWRAHGGAPSSPAPCRARPRWLAAIIGSALLAVALAGIASNPIAALYTFLGAFFYGVVYTVWLKRRSGWNIVIGGLAGSFAVLAGAAAVAPGGALEPLPLRSRWCCSCGRRRTSGAWRSPSATTTQAAGVPMLPVVVGDARAARAVQGSAALLVASTLVPAIFGMGWLYLAAAVGGGGYLLLTSTQLGLAPNRRRAMVNFHATLIQLTVLLVAAIVDSAFRV